MSKWLIRVLFVIALNFTAVSTNALESGFTITIDKPTSISAVAPDIISSTNFVGIDLESKTEGFGVSYLITNNETNEIIFKGESFLYSGETSNTLGDIQTGKLTLKYNEDKKSVGSSFVMNASSGTYNVVVKEIQTNIYNSSNKLSKLWSATEKRKR